MNASSGLRALVAKWRIYDGYLSAARSACADELESILAAPQAAPAGMAPSAYQIANNFDAHRKGLPDEFQDWAAEISRDLRQLAAPAGMVLVPSVCDGKEQDAFEDWAKSQKYYMETHPLHWLFLDRETYSARQGWAAAIRYVGTILAAAPAAQLAEPVCSSCRGKGYTDGYGADGSYDAVPCSDCPSAAAPAVMVDEAMVERYCAAVNEHLGKLSAEEWAADYANVVSATHRTVTIGLAAALNQGKANG